MRKSIYYGLFFVLLSGTRAAACPAPDGSASLLKSLDEFDRGIQALHLPKDQTNRLSTQGREQMIRNHIVSRDIDCSKLAPPTSNPRLPSEEELAVQRKIIRQNNEIIDEANYAFHKLEQITNDSR